MFVSYSIELRWASDKSYMFYRNINPTQIEYGAKLLGYKGKGLHKLINHTSKKYTYIRTNELYIDKHFHESEPEYEDFDIQWERNSEAFNLIHNI